MNDRSGKPPLFLITLGCLLVALFSGACWASHRTAGQSDSLGLKGIATFILTIFGSGISFGLIWFWVLFLFRFSLAPSQKNGVSVSLLIFAGWLWAVAVIPVIYSLFIHFEQKNRNFLVENAMAAPASQRALSALPTNKDFDGSVIVGKWLGGHPDLPADKLNEVVEKFPQNEMLLRAVARHQNASQSILEKLYKLSRGDGKSRWEQRWVEEIARNPNASRELRLQILRNSCFSEARAAAVEVGLGKDPEIYQEYLTISALSSDDYVRMKAARDPKISLKLLHQLSQDSDSDVRRAVASNPAVTFEILQQLNRDSDLYVREKVIHHEKAKKEWRISYLQDAIQGRDAGLRGRAIEMPEATPAMLRNLAADEAWGVRLMVVYHPNCPPDVFEKLKNDPHPEVKRGALSRLNRTED
jgi:hypothetical protein